MNKLPDMQSDSNVFRDFTQKKFAQKDWIREEKDPKKRYDMYMEIYKEYENCKAFVGIRN